MFNINYIAGSAEAPSVSEQAPQQMSNQLLHGVIAPPEHNEGFIFPIELEYILYV